MTGDRGHLGYGLGGTMTSKITKLSEAPKHLYMTGVTYLWSLWALNLKTDLKPRNHLDTVN